MKYQLIKKGTLYEFHKDDSNIKTIHRKYPGQSDVAYKKYAEEEFDKYVNGIKDIRKMFFEKEVVKTVYT